MVAAAAAALGDHFVLRDGVLRPMPAAFLKGVLPRLRCQACGGPPALVALVESAATAPNGERQGWRVELV